MTTTRSYRVPDIPFWLFAVAIGFLSCIPVAAVLVIALVPEIRDRKETPARIAGCHAQGGTAELDRRGVYRGCLVPAPKQP